MELLRTANCDRLVVLVRLGAAAFAVQLVAGEIRWRALSRVKPCGA